jgi:transglutaminase-like putative cysteine protease
MRLHIHHRTAYHYDEPAQRVVQLLRVTPAHFSGQSVIDWRIDVDCDARLREGRDGYGNVTHMLYVDRPTDALAVTVSGKVVTEDRAGVVEALPHDLPPALFLRATRLTRPGPALHALAARVDGTGALDTAHRLSALLHETIRFDVDATEADTSAEHACAEGHGVCQDFAQMFVSVAQLLGIPARYVSGHLYRRDGALSQSAAHAWAEAWIDDLGWLGFDPVNGISPDDAYVRVACGLDYREAAPVAGARSGGGAENLSVEVEVSRSPAQSQTQS